MLTRFVPDNLPVRFFPFAFQVTVPFRPIVASAGIGIVFQIRISVPITLSKVAKMLHENLKGKFSKLNQS